jgi:hypothetical protein
MKAALIRANHGNHTGFDRKWSLVLQGTKTECNREKSKYKEEIEDNHRFVVITQSDIYNDFFNGSYNGYFPTCLNGIFETN